MAMVMAMIRDLRIGMGMEMVMVMGMVMVMVIPANDVCFRHGSASSRDINVVPRIACQCVVGLLSRLW